MPNEAPVQEGTVPEVGFVGTVDHSSRVLDDAAAVLTTTVRVVGCLKGHQPEPPSEPKTADGGPGAFEQVDRNLTEISRILENIRIEVERL